MSGQNSGFYNGFSLGGFLGVNQLSLGEMLSVNFATLIVMCLIFGLVSAFLPAFLLLFYILFLFMGNHEGDVLDRLRVNVVSVLACVYFLVDFHYGLLGWASLNAVFGSETLNYIAHVNLSILILNVLLFIFGNKIFLDIRYGLARVGLFFIILFFAKGLLVPFSSVIVDGYIPQHVKEVKDELIIEDTSNNNADTEDLDEYLKRTETESGYYNETEYEENEYNNGEVYINTEEVHEEDSFCCEHDEEAC